MLKGMEKILELMDAPLANILSSCVSDTIESNASLASDAGFKAYITRTGGGNCCNWCAALEGTYEYPCDKEVYRRHDNCTCTVLYHCERGVQNAHTKRWQSEQRQGIIDYVEENFDDEGNKILENISECSNHVELRRFFKNEFDITIQNEVAELRFDDVKEALKGVDYILKEFPQAINTIEDVGCENFGVMCASRTSINFNKTYFGKTNPKSLKGMIMGNERGFHPKNTGIFEVGAHEAGHILESALIDKSDYPFKILAWNDRTESKRIISQACKNAKKTLEGKGKKNFTLKSEVSGYALQNSSECMAECIADYTANKENASILSKEVWKLLKEELA